VLELLCPLGIVGDAFQAIGTVDKPKNRRGQSYLCIRAQIAQTALVRNTSLEQNLRTQIVANAGYKSLIEQQTAQAPAAKTLVIKTRNQRVDRYLLVEWIRPETGQIINGVEFVRAYQADIRGAVEARRLVAADHREPQLAASTWFDAWLANTPLAIELVVAVNTPRPVVAFRRKEHQYGLAACLDGCDLPTGQHRLEVLESFEGKEHLVGLALADRLFDIVDHPSDFRTFRHACGSTKTVISSLRRPASKR
jgi:hypothetical protein